MLPPNISSSAYLQNAYITSTYCVNFILKRSYYSVHIVIYCTQSILVILLTSKHGVNFLPSSLSSDNLVISNIAKYSCDNCYSTFGDNVKHFRNSDYICSINFFNYEKTTLCRHLRCLSVRPSSVEITLDRGSNRSAEPIVLIGSCTLNFPNSIFFLISRYFYN